MPRPIRQTRKLKNIESFEDELDLAMEDPVFNAFSKLSELEFLEIKRYIQDAIKSEVRKK